MNPLLAAEWFKLRRSRVFALILAGAAAVTAIDVLTAYFLQETVLRGHNAVAVLASQSSFLSVWIAAFVGFFIAGEFPTGAVRNVLALGKDRTAVLFAKLCSACVGVFAIFAVVSFVATLGYSLALGFGDSTLGAFAGRFVAVFLLQLVFHLPQAAVFTMFALLSRSTGVTILLSIGYVIAVLATGGFLNAFPGGSLKAGLQLFPEYYISKLFSAATNELNLDPAFLMRGAAVCAAYCLVATFIAAVAFRRSDVK
jgi:ABC-2 type transport system permease protein